VGGRGLGSCISVTRRKAMSRVWPQFVAIGYLSQAFLKRLRPGLSHPNRMWRTSLKLVVTTMTDDSAGVAAV